MSGRTGTGERELWLRRFRRAPDARARLVCFPHAGSSAGYFRPMSERLAQDVDVLAVQYPGRQDRRFEPLVRDVVKLADRISDVVQDGTDLPLAFFGHSMGAVVAYETARLLERKAGTRLRALFVSGRRAPSRVRDERVHLGSDDSVLAELLKLGGTDMRVLRDPELRELVLPVIRADYLAIERYRHAPGPEPSCPISVLIGDADPMTTLAEARAWSRHSTAAVDMRTFPGGHFFLDRHWETVAESILRSLIGPA